MEDVDDDYRLVARWLSDERVLEFAWGRDDPYDEDRVRQKYGPRIRHRSDPGDGPDGRGRVVPCILLYKDEPIGFLQYYPVTGSDSQNYGTSPELNTFALDLAIGEPELWDKGLGTRFLKVMLAFLYTTKGAQRILIDPRVNNSRAVRCYEKSGFQKIKGLPKHELFEGEYQDTWLMMARP